MAYSIDYRKRVLEYLEEGHTQAEAQAIFKVGTTTMKAWKKLLFEKNTLEKKPLKRDARVYPSDKLCAYIKENPLEQIASFYGSKILWLPSHLLIKTP